MQLLFNSACMGLETITIPQGMRLGCLSGVGEVGLPPASRSISILSAYVPVFLRNPPLDEVSDLGEQLIRIAKCQRIGEQIVRVDAETFLEKKTTTRPY